MRFSRSTRTSGSPAIPTSRPSFMTSEPGPRRTGRCRPARRTSLSVSTASIDAVTFLTRSLKKYAQPGPQSTDAADRSKLMATGKAYQSTVWPGEITGIVEDPTVSQVKGKVAYIPIPQGASGKGLGMMGNWLLGIPRGSKNGSAAADFIKWMLKPDNMRNYVAQGGIPIRKSILNDASLAAANPYFKA